MKQYRERSGLQLSTGNFYRELQRLSAEDLVRSASKPADADPRRAPYEVTDAGLTAFDAWLRGPLGTAIGRYDDELSSRVLFVMDTQRSAPKLLARWKEELWLRSKLQEQARNRALVDEVRHANAFTVLPLILARRLKHIAADLEFLDEFGAAYEQWLARDESPSAACPSSAISQRTRRSTKRHHD